MMLKNILRLTIPAMTVAGVSQSALAAVTTQPYFNVQEIGVDNDVVTPSLHRLRGTAMSLDGNHIAAKTQGFRDPFSNYDINLPFSFSYGCQYADVICEAAWRGYQSHGDDLWDGFFNYRDTFTQAFRGTSSGSNPATYTSRLVALTTRDLNLSSSDVQLTTPTDFPTTTILSASDGGSVLSVANSSKNRDTRITDMTSQEITVDNKTDYWVTGYYISPLEASGSVHGTPARGFIESLDGTKRIALTPYNTTLTAGGLSAGYHFGHSGSEWFVTGTTAIAEAEDNDKSDGSFSLCYSRPQDIDESDDFQSGEYYRYCPGFKTQTAVWSLTNVTNDAIEAVIPAAVSSGGHTYHWLGDDGDVNHSASGLGANSNGIIAGYVTHRDGSGDLDAYARASLYQYTGSGNSVTLTPYLLQRNTSSGIVGDHDDDNIRDQWAIDITNSINGNYFVFGNERVTAHEAAGSRHNQTVNFFVSKIPEGEVSSANGNVSWPLRNSSGTSNQIAAIDHSTGLAVGWRETSNSISAYNGIRRTQSAFLYDATGIYPGTDHANGSWLLQRLTCYAYTDDTTGNVSLHMPLYRIEHASAVSTDGGNLTILASGYKYPNVQDYIDRWNAMPVILKLTHTPGTNADIDSLSGCPVYEEDTKHSRSGGSAGWLALLLLPGLFVRVITKWKQTLSAS